MDIKNDVKAFVDPHALTYIESDWSRECVSLIQSFFNEVMDAIHDGNDQHAQRLLSSLSEPNEAHLGLSKGKSAGSGVGPELASEIWAALSESRASQSGLLSELQDAILFVDNIGHDRVSDMTINIIGAQLISFTQDACKYYGIPLFSNVVSGPLWDRKNKVWRQEYTKLPVPNSNSGKLLLIPKSIVRRTGIFDPGEYYTHHVLPYLQRAELGIDGPLVRQRRNGVRYVTKLSLRERDEDRPTKHINVDVTEGDATILDRYRRMKARPTEPLSHDELAQLTSTPKVEWEKLLNNVVTVPPGQDGADAYHRAIQALLTPLFYPALDMPKREAPIHNGRKRIDITYANTATRGFFWWLLNSHKAPASDVVVECKNYGRDIKNPEFDQLAGRFSPRRGKFGLLCYRGFNDKADVVQRCRDAALDDRGYIIALDDNDLRKLVDARSSGSDVEFSYLYERFREII